MNEKLKPCPFCGRHHEEIEITSETANTPFYVECPCGCTLFTDAHSMRGAVDAWNRRTNDE